MRNLFLYANYYHRLGFNITHIVPDINKKRNTNKNPYKSSTNDRTHLRFQRQEFSEIESFNWNDALGIGTELGFNGLRALDFDNSNDEFFISWVLDCLELPSNYEWVIQSGSKNGFHILFYSDNHNFPVQRDRIKAFNPNSANSEYFKRVELRWTKHLVLPPSQHKSGNKYDFSFCDLPLSKPKTVSISLIEKCLKEICYEDGGYNTKPNQTISSQEYEYDHDYLDVSPIIIEQQKIKPSEIKSNENILDQYGIKYLFHMTHKSNIANIFNNGLLSHNNAYNNKLNQTDIADSQVNSRRTRREPVFGMSIHDYVPLYFNPKNPMLFKRREMQDEIVILALDRNLIYQSTSLFTDGNAASKDTKFFNELKNLNQLNWQCLNNEFWNDYPDGKRIKCAEVLVYSKIEYESIRKIFTRNKATKQFVEQKDPMPFGIPVEVTNSFYFSGDFPTSVADDLPF